jgi:hypothetical protein
MCGEVGWGRCKEQAVVTQRKGGEGELVGGEGEVVSRWGGRYWLGLRICMGKGE